METVDDCMESTQQPPPEKQEVGEEGSSSSSSSEDSSSSEESKNDSSDNEEDDGLHELMAQIMPPAGRVEQTAVHDADMAGKSAPIIELGGENWKTMIKELVIYMKTWLSGPENACHLMPSLAQKGNIIQETGIEK